MAAPRAGGAPVECSSPATPSIDGATITLDGDWAELSVRRWRFVHIDLFEEPLYLTTER